MTYFEAHQLLDKLKDGNENYSRFVIDRALALTGDHEAHRGERMVAEVQPENQGCGQRKGDCLVASNNCRHCTAQGRGCR